MRAQYLILIASSLFLLLSEAKCNETNSSTTLQTHYRDERFLSLFSIVRFPNSFCTGTNSYNGTCLTSSECATYGGTGSGTCASGFGVCCIVAINSCGKTALLNNTYWQNPSFPTAFTASGQCSLFVEKISSNICQLRLDFVDFQLAQPDASSTLTLNGQCLTDSFTVSGAAYTVPTICGLNDKQHIYVHMTPGTNTFTLNMLTSGTTTNRMWNILIRQIPCGTTYTAPDGCLQWYTEASGTLTSYNFQYAAAPLVQHLAYQDYTICIRMNQGFCGIKYDVCSTSYPSFSVSAKTAAGPTPPAATPAATPAPTAAYGSSDQDSPCATDWLQIPCASDQQNSALLSGSPVLGCVTKICGQAFNVKTLTSPASAAQSSISIYSYRKPFELRFYTDSGESGLSTNSPEAYGFCLTYTQQPCISTGSGR